MIQECNNCICIYVHPVRQIFVSNTIYMQKPELNFYTMMQYPIPNQEQYFYYKSKSNEKTQPSQKKEQNAAMQLHRDKINKYTWLRKNLPYIEHIYLCDSMSFNAADEKSDIDLFFIVRHGCIWRARLLSVIICSILGIKRSLKKKSGLFDLIFYVDERHTNLQNISLQPEDIYLTYRLAHLIPLYQSKPYNIYTDNTRIQSTLPNFPMTHTIQWNIEKWSGWFKKIREFLWGIKPDNFWEQAIKRLWKPLVITKKKKHKDSWRWIVITDHMLKFHKDKRIQIQQKRESQKQI